MLTKFQTDCYKLIGWSFGYLYEVPIRWDPVSMQIYTLPKRKWYAWYIGQIFVLIMWLCCIYILCTTPFFYRKNFDALHFSLLCIGFLAFGSVLLVANSLTSSNIEQKLTAANTYLRLELLLQRRYGRKFLQQKFNILDASFLVINAGNFIPQCLFLACIYLNLDGMYWTIEDWAPNPTERDLNTILLYLLIRIFFTLPGFIETGRTIVAMTPMIEYLIVSAERTLWILTYRVNDLNIFFKLYSKFSVICCILEEATKRLWVAAVTICYLLFLQTWWILIQGWNHLQPAIYAMFAATVLMLSCSIVIFMPHFSRLGETIIALPKIKKAEIKQKYINHRSLENKIAIKKANAIKPLSFSYGGFYPLGANFCRNLFGNVLENLMSLVLLLDYHGNISL